MKNKQQQPNLQKHKGLSWITFYFGFNPEVVIKKTLHHFLLVTTTKYSDFLYIVDHSWKIFIFDHVGLGQSIRLTNDYVLANLLGVPW